MTAFVIYRAKGEIFDYDFEKVHRAHKLERIRFNFCGFPMVKLGLTITDKCIGCGKFRQACSFDAIYQNGAKYTINGNRCDEYGNCFLICPVNTIILKGMNAVK